MMLTPRAEALIVPVLSALRVLGRALGEPSDFVPATARRAFRLSSPDLFDVVVIPELLARLHRQAPSVDLAVLPLAGARLCTSYGTSASRTTRVTPGFVGSWPRWHGLRRDEIDEA